MLAKYAKNKHVLDCQKPSSYSSTWNRMLKSRDIAENYIYWIVGVGKINFWKDWWLPQGRLINLVTPPSGLESLTVRDGLISFNNWWPAHKDQLAAINVPEILNMLVNLN